MKREWHDNSFLSSLNVERQEIDLKKEKIITWKIHKRKNEGKITIGLPRLFFMVKRVYSLLLRIFGTFHIHYGILHSSREERSNFTQPLGSNQTGFFNLQTAIFKLEGWK